MVIGFGYAGQRFARALDHISEDEGRPVELVGLVDLNPVHHGGLPTFATVSEGLRELAPDVVCVTVNEHQHEGVFDELADYRPCLLLSEKPLTTDVVSATRVAKNLHRHEFSLNLVERFTPLIPRYRAWAAAHPDLRIVRAEAHWGKHRIFDHRPTMGVLSELIHPLDLVRHLFPPVSSDLVYAQAVSSDLEVSGQPRMDSIDASIDVAGVPVLLHASFAWPERVRTVTALARSGGSLFRILFHFDQPHWDCDRLEILEITASGRWHPVLKESTDVSDLPEQIAGVGKVATYIRRSLGVPVPDWPDSHDGLVGLDEAVELQRLLEVIGDATTGSTVRARYRGPEA